MGDMTGFFTENSGLEKALRAFLQTSPQRGELDSKNQLWSLAMEREFSFDIARESVYRRKPSGKNELLFRSLGLDETTPWLVDATVGLGIDAFFCLRAPHLKNLQVLGFERHPWVFSCLALAVQRQKKDYEWLQRFHLRFGSVSEHALQALELKAPAPVYYDPMFEKETYTSALPRKHAQYLREIVGPEPGPLQELERLLNLPVSWVTVKKTDGAALYPFHSQGVWESKSVQFVRYTASYKHKERL